MKGDGIVKLTRTLVKGHTCPCVSVTGAGQVIADGCVFSDSKTILVSLKGSGIASFTQCLFDKAGKGGISSVEQSAVILDSCKFNGCHVDIGNDSPVNVVKGCTFSVTGAALVCAMTSECYIYQNTITGGCIDGRDQSMLNMGYNTFTNGYLLLWGRSRAKSIGDSFTGEATAAIGVTQNAILEIESVKITNVWPRLLPDVVSFSV